MTANEIYQNALALVSQTVQDSKDIEPFVPSWLNILFSEVLQTENSIRENIGEKQLETAPVVTLQTMDTQLPFQTQICNPALVYGLVSFIYADEENDFKEQNFRQKYISALSDVYIASISEVYDVYKD